jgi:hypothetical protein
VFSGGILHRQALQAAFDGGAQARHGLLERGLRRNFEAQFARDTVDACRIERQATGIDRRDDVAAGLQFAR